MSKLQRRIRTAIENETALPTPKAAFDERVSRIQSWLAAVSMVKIDQTASLIEIWEGSSYDWSAHEPETFPGFHFKTITSQSEKTALAKELSTRSQGGDENYPWQKWISKGPVNEPHHLLVAVYPADDPRPAGFAIWHSTLFLDNLKQDATSFRDQDPDLLLQLDLESIYVTPELRGMGYASALRWAFVEHTKSVLDIVADLPMSRVKNMGNPSMRVFYSGEAHSVGGALVARSISDGIETALEDISATNPAWFGDVQMEDDFDYDNFLDKAAALDDPLPLLHAI